MDKKKILVIRFTPLKYFIHCMPAFAAIRKKHEHDEITILTEESLIAFSKRSHLFDKVWLDSKPEWFQVNGLRDIIKRLRAGHFDMVYDLQNDSRSAWYFKFMGYNKPRWNSSVVDWCSDYYRIDNDEMHFQDIIHNQLKVAGIKSTPIIDISYTANDEANELPERFAMICSGGDREKKAHKWHPGKYAEIIDYLFTAHGLVSVLVGDGGDDNLINTLIHNQCVRTKPINFSGKTSINGLVAVAKKAEFCLGNDTAPTHIAAYSSCKTIMICSRFSPPELVAPLVKNIAFIEEPMLENVDIDRAIKAIEEFGLIAIDSDEFKAYKTISSNIMIRPDVIPTLKIS